MYKRQEKFCYEFTCKAGGEDCIVYIDCETGKEAVSYTHLDVYKRQEHIKNPRSAMKKGVALLPEDRKKEGLCLGLSVDFNTNRCV